MEASSPSSSSIWVGFQQGAVKVAGTDLHSVREQAAVGLGLKVAPGFIFFTVDEEADIIPPDKPLQELIADGLGSSFSNRLVVHIATAPSASAAQGSSSRRGQRSSVQPQALSSNPQDYFDKGTREFSSLTLQVQHLTATLDANLDAK